MAGGDVKPGCSHGATDKTGYHAVEYWDQIHAHHATVLHLPLGLQSDQPRLRNSGRDFRLLTEVSGVDAHGSVR